MRWNEEPPIDMRRFKLDSEALNNMEDKPSYQDMIDAGYIMSDDGIWMDKPEDDEV